MKATKFLWIIFAIQLTIIGLVGSAFFGFDIPVLRQIVGFIYLTFVPGFLLLRILKLQRLGTIETLLYSAGLSIACVMFTGFFMNMLYPLIGISKPISILPVIVTITLIVLILCVVAYKREIYEEELVSQRHSIHWSELLSPPALFLLLLPIIAALGTFLVNFHRGNILSLIFLFLVVVVVILVTFGKFIPAKLYPLAVVTIGLGLLWQWSLISPDLTGFDSHHEYYVQNLVLSNSVWDPNIPWNVNAMLSVVMLAPIYSLVLNLNTVWVFKFVYPLLFSLVPLALFQVYRKQTDDEIAFLGVFFFMSTLTFFAVMTDAMRQQIAELFLALSILLFLDKEMAAVKKAALLIIFGFSIVVSHYGLSYIYILYLLMALPLLWRGNAVMELLEGMVARFSKFRRHVSITHWSLKPANGPLQGNTLHVTYVMLFLVFCLSWYMYVSSGSSFNAIIEIGDHIYSSLRTELFSSSVREGYVMQAVGLGPRAVGVEQHISRTVHHATHLFIIVGVIELIRNLRKMRFHPEYVAMTLLSMLILAMCVVLPYFASALNMIRIYHIALFFLAPFCILGGKAIFRWLFRFYSSLLRRNLSISTALTAVVILVLVPYFLFNTGFVRELTGNTPRVMTLSLYEEDSSFFTKPEISARKWLRNVGPGGFTVFSDLYGSTHLGKEFCGRVNGFPSDPSKIYQSSYIFLRRWNIIHKEVLLSIQTHEELRSNYINLEDETAFSNAFQDRNKIYDSGWAQVLGPR